MIKCMSSAAGCQVDISLHTAPKDGAGGSPENSARVWATDAVAESVAVFSSNQSCPCLTTGRPADANQDWLVCVVYVIIELIGTYHKLNAVFADVWHVIIHTFYICTNCNNIIPL